jgi:MYXO-CTERM domain-containing protein
MAYGLSAGFAVAGLALITGDVVGDVSWPSFLPGGGWLLLAVGWFFVGRQYRRREQLGFDRELPGAGQDVQTLLRQGRKIEAIKLYRQLHPGIGLREARHAVDEL